MHRAPIALLIALTLTACGGTPPPSTSPLATTGVVGGRVLLSESTHVQPSRLVVSLVSAQLSASVSSLGDFVLPNVPAGALELHFSGDGLAAGLRAGTIEGGETVTVTVRIDGSTATVESIARVRGDEATIEGPVEAPPSSLPPGTIIVAGRSVTLPPGAPALTPGMRVRVTGAVTGAGIVARDVVIL